VILSSAAKRRALKRMRGVQSAADTEESLGELKSAGDLQLGQEPGEGVPSDEGGFRQFTEGELLPVPEVGVLAVVGPVRVESDRRDRDEQVHVAHGFGEDEDGNLSQGNRDATFTLTD
jgi:hypothetical protein